jgi:hypothetical protein
MKDLMSRYGQVRKVTDNGHGIFTIEGESRYWRAGMSEDNTKVAYVDPEGGPFIHIDEDYGFGKIREIHIDKSAKENHFKVRVEVEV